MSLRQGFSLVELLIGIAVLGILIAAVTALSGRFFTVSRTQFEQTRTTEEARVQLERITDIVRNGRAIDCDGNPQTDTPAEGWLQTANATSITFYSNVDSDAAAERVTYEQVGADLVRTVDQDSPTACSFVAGTPNIVAHSLYNSTAQPLFAYVGAGGATLAPPIDLKAVTRVKVLLVVDSDGANLSNAALITTDITPRLGQEIAAVAASSPLPTATPTPSTVPTVTPTPTPTPVPVSPGTIALFISSSAIKLPPERSPTGPVWLDVGEQWGVAIEYDAGSGSKTIIMPGDPDLSFASNTTAIVTVQNGALAGRLLGKAAGDAEVTATYKGATLTFRVEVRDGCWRVTNGGWVPTLSYPQPVSTICRNAGYSATALCGRVCPNVVQPGSDSHLQSLSPLSSSLWAGTAPGVYGCSGGIYPGGGQRFEQLFCAR